MTSDDLESVATAAEQLHVAAYLVEGVVMDLRRSNLPGIELLRQHVEKIRAAKSGLELILEREKLAEKIRKAFPIP